MPVKKKSKINLKKSAAARRRPKSRSKGRIVDSQMGFFMLMAAALALLVSFHFAHDRLAPAKPLVRASVADLGLGK